MNGDGTKGLKTHFVMLAAHAAWANRLLFEAVLGLDRALQVAEPGGMAPSLPALLHDMITFDRLWIYRFTGEGDATGRSSAPAKDNLKLQKAARAAEDMRMLAWLSALPPERFEGRFSYMNVGDMRTVSRRLAPALAHYFDRQAHCRGTACALLAVLGATPPALGMDLFHKSEDGRAYA